jgi:hypothetical protein
LLNRQIAGFRAFEDLVDQARCPIIKVGIARSVAQEPSDVDEFAGRVGGRQFALRRKIDDHLGIGLGKRVDPDQQRIKLVLRHALKNGGDG